jgi:hypothetical protein
MFRSRDKAIRLYCFSPPVMVATFCIEVGLLIYTAIKRKPSVIVGLGIAMLFFLATFQLSEYSICGRLHLNGESWTRVGYVAITMLPVLGIHMISRIVGSLNPWWTRLAYTTGLAWSSVFLFANVFNGLTCGGNYIIFEMLHPFGGAYFAYYYLWLLLGIGWSLHYLRLKKTTKHHKKALAWLIAGYLVFLLPTTIINSMYPDTQIGIPSIMCGFAVLFALILTFRILPATEKRASKKRK